MNLQVRKKNGALEPFTAGKIANSIVKAGGTVELAAEILERVKYYASNAGKKGIIDSRQIKSKVVDELLPKDAKTAHAYKNFKKKG